MRKVYSISFTDERVIKRLNEVQSKSRYLKDVILRDVDGGLFSEEQITKKKKMIDKKLKGYTPAVNEENKPKEEKVRAIDDFFNEF